MHIINHSGSYKYLQLYCRLGINDPLVVRCLEIALYSPSKSQCIHVTLLLEHGGVLHNANNLELGINGGRE